MLKRSFKIQIALLIRSFFMIYCSGIPASIAADSCASNFIANNSRQAPVAKSFEEVVKQVENVDLSQLREQIEVVYKDPGLTKEQKNQKAFKLYLSFRLKEFPLSKKKEILKRMKRIEVVERTDDVRGFYFHSTDTLRLEMPKQYFGSVLELAIRVHEIEHLIQDVEVGKWRETESPFKRKYFTEFLFSAEKGAMLAEANFLLSLPRHVAMDDLREPAKHYTIAEKFREGVYGAKGSPAEYIFIQWNAFNRYSKAEFAQDYFVKVASSRPVLGTAGIISLLALIQSMHSYLGF